MAEPTHPTSDNDRRSFFKKVIASVIGAAVGLVPVGAGLMVFLDPLRRKASAGGAVQVATLDALPEDGLPHKFPILADRTDAWNKFKQTPIGAVYLRRTRDGKLQAFNVVCPHAGCFVDFIPGSDSFLCPCHNSAFTLDGKIADRASPSPRGLDSLEVELRKGREVWVKFQNFQAGRAEKVPAA